MKDKLLISPAIRRILQIWSWIGIFIVLLLSILDIIGWIFNFPRLTGFNIFYTPMKPVTAISILLCSAAFVLLAIDLKGKIQNLIVNLSALIVGLIGLFTLISYLGFYFTGKEIAITTAPLLELIIGPSLRMALLTACCFLIISMVFFLLSTHKPQAAGVAHGLIIFPLSLSYFVLMSYLLGVYHIHEIQNVAVALNTGIALFLLCIVLLFLNPGSWIMNKFTGNYAGSLMARRLLPGVILLPVIIGWLRIQGEQHGLFSSEVGVTLVALTYTLCFLGLIWLTAFSVNRSDKERVRNEIFLNEAQRIAKIGSWEWNVRTGKIYWSNQMYQMFGEEKGKFVPTFDGFVLHVHPEDRQKMEDAIKETIEKDTPFNIEYRILTKTAGECYVAAHADVLRDENNEVQLFIGTVHDISDRKKYEEALQASRESLSTTLASIGDAVIATDIQGNITFLNRVAEELTRWDYEDAMSKPANEVFHIINEQTRLEVEDPVAKVLKTGMIEGLANHTILVRKDGSEIPIDDSGAPIYRTSGQIAGVVLVFRDITERKKAEQSLAESEQRYKLLVDSLPDASVLLFDRDHRYLITRGQEIRNSGFDPDKLEGQTLKEAFQPDIAELFTPLYDKALKGESTSFEHQYAELVYSQQVLPVYGINGEINSGLVISRNITAQKRAQEEIRRSNEHLEKIYNHSNAPFICWTADNKITRFNHAFERMTGYLAEEVLDKDLSLLFPIESKEESLVEIKNALSGEFWADVEIPILRKDGKIRIALWNSANIYEEDGKTLITTIAQGQDITERKKAEEETRLAKEDWERTFDAIPDLVAIIDTDHQIRRANKAMAEKLKISTAECVGMHCYEAMHCTDKPPDFCPHSKLLKDGLDHNLEIWESQWNQDFHISTSPIMGDRGQLLGSVHVVRDISERKQAEELIRRTNDFLEKIFNHSNVPFICWDTDNKITRFNHAFERMTGYLTEEVLEKDLSFLFPEQSKDESLNKIKKTLSGEFWADVEIPILRKDDNIRLVLWNSANIYEGDGKTLITTIAQGQDITERKKAEEALRESQEHLQSVLDSSIDVIYRFNLQTERYEYFSPSSIKVFGYTSEEFIRMDLKTATAQIHPDDLDRVHTLLANLNDSGTGKLDYRFKFKNGDYRWISNHLLVIRDAGGRPLYRDGNVRDITELKRYEDEIIAANEELTLFNSAMVGRELRMIELKKEINQLCAEVNKRPVYEIGNEEVQ